MLTIRSAQVEVFSEEAMKSFEELMLPHLKKFFSEFCAATPEPKLKAFIRYGVKRAGSYDITAKRDVSRYIDLMVSLGADFDKDPQLPWAGQILHTRNKPDVKISTLLKTAEKYLAAA